jgi:acetoin utilization protein AcuB
MKKALVRQWMTTQIIKADPHMRLHDALRLMNRASIRTLPVVDDGQLVGIVTKRDLLRADVTTVMKDPWEQYRRVGNTPLEKIMTHAVITIDGDTQAAKAARIMEDNKITALPVVGEGHAMVGILTSTDLFRLLLEEIPGLHEIIRVSDYMSRDVQTISPVTTLLDAQRLMAVKNIRALPVIQESLLVGIITRTDLLSAAPGAAAEGQYEIAKQILTTPARFIMTSAPITVSESDPVTKAAALMQENKIHSLPVLDAARSLCGIITETDLFRLIVNKFL